MLLRSLRLDGVDPWTLPRKVRITNRKYQHILPRVPNVKAKYPIRCRSSISAVMCLMGVEAKGVRM